MSQIPQNNDLSYTLLDRDGMTVTLTFPGKPRASFTVFTKDLPGDLPAGYEWLFNFEIKTPGGQSLPSVTYTLKGTNPPRGQWRIYYMNDKSVRGLNGEHTTPGDPPIGYG